MPLPRRRAALPVLAAVLVPLSLIRVLFGLLPFPGADPARVVNGLLVLPAGVVEALVVPFVWAWAVTAGIAAAAPLDRPLRRALRALPTVCAALLAGVGTVLAALLLLGLVLPARPEVVLVVGALLVLVITPLLVRVALVPPIAVLDGLRGRAAFRAASADVRGLVASFAFSLLVGVAAPALLHGWAFGHLEEHVSGPLPGLLAWLLRDLSLIAVAVLQAWTLLGVHRDLPGLRLARDGDEGPPAAEPVRPFARRAGRLAVPLGVAGVLLPTVLAGGVVAAQRLPEVTVLAGTPHQMIAVAWPAGRGPILVGQTGIEDCLDDRCRTTRRTALSVTMYEPYGGAAFGPDGSVYALGQYELEHCDARRVCRRAEGGLSALRGSRAAAITLSPAGEILLASATEIPPRRSGDGAASDQTRKTELKLIRCPDVRCVDPTVTRLGVVDGALQARDNTPTRLMIRARAGGEPVVAFLSPSTGVLSIGWCTTPDCGQAGIAPFGVGASPGMPPEAELRSLDFDGIFDCPQGCGDGAPIATVHRPQGQVYDVVVERGRPDGLQVQVGAVQMSGRAVLRICADDSCPDPRRIPLPEVPAYIFTNQGFFPEQRRWLMAVAPDGRAVITDRFANYTLVVGP